MIDEMDPDGSSVDVAPSVRFGSRPGDISWTTATVAYPYAAYKGDGDLEPAKMYFEELMLHIANLGRQCDGVAGISCPTKYGDWVPPNPPGQGQGPKPSKPFTSAFSYVDSVAKVAELATAIGNKTAATALVKLHQKLSNDFNSAFLASNGTYDNGVMTTYTLPLHLGIVPNDKMPEVQKNLLDLVATKNNDHNMCGIIGMKFLFEQLAAMGREDTALSVLEGTSYPSLGFMAYNSYEKATENVWELWDAYTEGTGMNSRNHHMFSSYSKYLLEHVVGFVHRPLANGSHQLRFNPSPELGVSGASVSVSFDHGKAEFEWERSGGVQCSKVPAGEIAELSCGRDGGFITNVRFASWGTPFGSCGSFGESPSCHKKVTKIVENMCLGRENCSIPASVDVLGGVECPSMPQGELARLYLEAECSGLPAYHVSVQVPLASQATVRVPTAGISSPTLSGVDVTNAVAKEVDNFGRQFVTKSIGSGNYELTLRASTATRIVEASARGARVELSCPPDHVASRVRFASFGNPKRRHVADNLVFTRGTCHIGSVIADAEAACLGRTSCEVVVDTTRSAKFADCVTGESDIVVQLECTIPM